MLGKYVINVLFHFVREIGNKKSYQNKTGV